MDSEYIYMPSFIWEDVKREGDSVSILSSALRSNKKLSIERISDNVIGISDSDLQQDILDTNIENLILTKYEQHSPDKAIEAAINSKELLQKLDTLKMRSAFSIPGLLYVSSNNGPHLPHNIKKTNLNGLFSLILSEFGGFIVYEDCIDPHGTRRYDINYYPVPRHHTTRTR
jgi:hypothetical protein